MFKDFHYCCVKTLAIAAGFDEPEADIIAASSQYVDDATEHKGVIVEDIPIGIPQIKNELFHNGFIEPVCTAHKGIQYIHGIRQDVQMKVYIPFHFLPSKPVVGQKTYEYRVVANSCFAQCLVAKAVKKYQEAQNDIQRLHGLIALGISLHTLADTWSHEGFSGKWRSKDNDIEYVQYWSKNKWISIRRIDQMKYNLIPDIGHGEAMDFPDISHMYWRYLDSNGYQITRHNPTIFFNAAEVIYRWLCKTTNTNENWMKLSNVILDCLSFQTDSIDSQMEVWKKQFPSIHFNYDPISWRSASLKGNSCDWDHIKTEKQFNQLRYQSSDDIRWFVFHLEAKKQRQFVMAHIFNRSILKTFD